MSGVPKEGRPMKVCACPEHPDCRRKIRLGRRQCSSCIDWCGPFGLDTKGRPRATTPSRVIGVTLVNGRATSLRLEQ